MMFFLVSITLPSSAAALIMPGASSATPKSMPLVKREPVQTFTVSGDITTSAAQIDQFSATSEAAWKKWHEHKLAVAAAKQAAAEAKKAAAAAKKAAAKKAKAAAIAAKKAAVAAASVSNVPVGAKQEYAFSYMSSTYGWSSSAQQTCLLNLWNRESGWSTTAANASGAYGIPQALPGSKMASQGSDWATNYKTQIRWGLGYISGSYGSPCAAWAHSNADGWY